MAIRGFYGLTEKIKELLEEDINVKSVSYGNLFEVATESNTTYPLSHFVVNNVDLHEKYYVFNVSLLCMDLIDQTNEKYDDYYAGRDNIHDIFQTQLMVLRKLISKLQSSDIQSEGYTIEGVPSVEAFKHKFKDDVAGWTATFDVLVLNDLSVC